MRGGGRFGQIDLDRALCLTVDGGFIASPSAKAVPSIKGPRRRPAADQTLRICSNLDADHGGPGFAAGFTTG